MTVLDTAAGSDEASIRSWVAEWGAEVAAVALDDARRRFSPDVVGFGTFAEVVRGLDELFANQWSKVWPRIRDFAFRADDLVALVSPDRLQAVAVVAWDSTGFDDDGQPFDRPGRATIVVQRASIDDPWLGVHTHFSLVP